MFQPLPNEIYEKMCQARREWEFASESHRHAAHLLQHHQEDAEYAASLKTAVAREAQALKQYRAAVWAYKKAVRNAQLS